MNAPRPKVEGNSWANGGCRGDLSCLGSVWGFVAEMATNEATLQLATQQLDALLTQREQRLQRQTRIKTPSPAIQSYRGKNHVLISRRSKRMSVRARLRKLLESGQFREVHVHGLGAALALAVAISAEMELESEGMLVAHARTSTEAVIDQFVEELEDGRTGAVRHNSAIHITLRRTV